MIAYAAFGLVWLATFSAWQFREQQHAKERMEMLKLYRSQSLSEYTDQKQEAPRPSNFMHKAITKAYNADLLGDDE